MLIFQIILFVLAFVLFLLAGIGVAARKYSLLAFGLASLTVALALPLIHG